MTSKNTASFPFSKADFLAKVLEITENQDWREDVMVQAATTLGEPGLYHHYFPKGIEDVIWYYHDILNTQMLEKMDQIPFDALRTTEKVTLLALTRIQLQKQHCQANRKLLKYLAHPTRAPLGTRLVFKMANTIWRRAGDTATDLNYYSKRAILGTVYSTSLVKSLQGAEDKAVEAFFKDQVQTIFKVTGVAKSIGSTVEKTLTSIPHCLSLLRERFRG